MRLEKIEDETLPTQFPVLHGLPVPGKPLVPGPPRPDVCRQLRMLVIPEQFGSIVRVTKPLHLETEIRVETAKDECNLVLKGIQVLGRRCAQFRRLDQETFRDIAAFAETLEYDEIVEEITVRSRFKHVWESRWC